MCSWQRQMLRINLPSPSLPLKDKTKKPALRCLPSAYSSFLFGFLSDPEYGGNIFLRNVGFSSNFTSFELKTVRFLSLPKETKFHSFAYLITLSVLYWPPLSSSLQGSWLQMQRFGFEARYYQIFLEVVGLERCPLSFLSKIKEVFGGKNSGSGLERRECGSRDPLRWPQNLALTSPTRGCCSACIIR
jgi:hypothetical protein